MATLEMFRGDTKKWNLTVTTDGIATDLTTAALDFTARTSPETSTVVFHKSVDDGITVTDALGGLARITLAPEDTDSLPSRGQTLFYDVQLTDNGEVHTIDSGSLVVKPDITTGV